MKLNSYSLSVSPLRWKTLSRVSGKGVSEEMSQETRADRVFISASKTVQSGASSRSELQTKAPEAEIKAEQKRTLVVNQSNHAPTTLLMHEDSLSLYGHGARLNIKPDEGCDRNAFCRREGNVENYSLINGVHYHNGVAITPSINTNF